jgi:hypothetical protein
MRYSAARQRQSDGKWDWTTQRGEAVYAVPPCGDGCPGHDTKEEAERHYYDYQLAKLKERSQDIKCRCEAKDCDVWTNKTLDTDLYDATYLCDAHRNKEVFEQLHPFHPGREIWES